MKTVENICLYFGQKTLNAIFNVLQINGFNVADSICENKSIDSSTVKKLLKC